MPQNQDWVSDAVTSWAKKIIKIMMKGNPGSWHSGHLIAESKNEKKRPAGVSRNEFLTKVLKGLKEDARFKVDGQIFFLKESTLSEKPNEPRADLYSQPGMGDATICDQNPLDQKYTVDRSSILSNHTSMIPESAEAQACATDFLDLMVRAASMECLSYFAESFRGCPFPCTKAELKQGIKSFLSRNSEFWLTRLEEQTRIGMDILYPSWESFKNDPRHVRKDFIRLWKTGNLYVGSSKVFSWNLSAVSEHIRDRGDESRHHSVPTERKHNEFQGEGTSAHP